VPWTVVLAEAEANASAVALPMAVAADKAAAIALPPPLTCKFMHLIQSQQAIIVTMTGV
jgi:hypothetical protein